MAAGITFHIGADNRKFVQVVRQTDSFLARQTAGMKTRMIAVGAAMGTFIGGAALKAFGAAARAARSAASHIKESFDLGGTLSDLSAQTGIAVRDLYILQKAFEDNGISGDKVGEKINKMQRFLAQVANGAKAPTESLARLGLTISDFAGLSPDKQFALLQSRIAALPSATMRAAVAMDIFGRSGAELLALFSSAGVLTDAERVFGEQADLLQKNSVKFDEISDRLNRAGAKFKGLYLGMASVFADALLPILDRIEGEKFVEKGKALGEMIANAVRLGMNTWTTAMRVMDHLRGLFATAAGLATYVVNPLWDGIRRVVDMLKAGFFGVVSIAQTLIADMLEMPMSFALDLQSGMEFAFQKAIEFFDDKLRGVINFLQAGIEWAIQQGFQGVSKIPVLNKLLGLKGFKAQSFDEIAKRNAAINLAKGFKAEAYQAIRDRNFSNSELMQFGMKVVEDLRSSATRSAQDAAAAWDDVMNRPRQDIMEAQAWFDTAKFYAARAAQPVQELMPAPLHSPSPLPVQHVTNDPWARFRNFATFSGVGALVTGGLQTGGLQTGRLGETHSLIRRGDAARRAVAERERDKRKTTEGTNELLSETNQILREALL